MSNQPLTEREAELILRLVNKCVYLQENVSDPKLRKMGLANDYGSASEIAELERSVSKLMAIKDRPHPLDVAVGQVYRGKGTGLKYTVVERTDKMAILRDELGTYNIRVSTLCRDFERVS